LTTHPAFHQARICRKSRPASRRRQRRCSAWPTLPRLAGCPRSSTGANAPDPGRDKAGDKPKKPEKTIDWGAYNHLLENFALIYGTDTVWDGGQRLIMKLANMAHAHGSHLVKMWKASPQRRTVLQQDVVFDPTGEADPERRINLYDGIALEPKPGNVLPLLDLIDHLLSRASEHYDECDDVKHWLLQWLAYPLQHPGAKLRTAIVMHGDEGAGKNFLFDLVASIYGKYGCLSGPGRARRQVQRLAIVQVLCGRRRGQQPPGAGAQQESAQGADHVAHGTDQPEEPAQA